MRHFVEDDKDSDEAAFALVKEAFKKWKRKEVAIDDITAIVVFFDNWFLKSIFFGNLDI